MGPLGPTGIVDNWIAYREFWFDRDASQIHDADRYLVEEIAAYTRTYPTLQVGIDDWAASGTNRSVCDSRVNAIRSSLISAGVPSDSVVVGSYGHSNHQRDGRVGVLLRTDRAAHAQASSSSSMASSERRSDRQERSAVGEDWSTLQSFWFDGDTSTIHAADMAKVTEIATYMSRNPSLRLAIDSSVDANIAGPRSRDRDLATSRGEAVKKALVDAGVRASSITTDALGDSRLRRDGRVAVLVRTERLSQAR